MSYEETPPTDTQLESRWETEAQERSTRMNDEKCASDGCERVVVTREWCGAHYQRGLASGEIQRVKDGTRPRLLGGSDEHRAVMTAVNIAVEVIRGADHD